MNPSDLAGAIFLTALMLVIASIVVGVASLATESRALTWLWSSLFGIALAGAIAGIWIYAVYQSSLHGG